MRKYINEFTGEELLLKSTEVWYHADVERLLGRRDATVYLHYRAWKNASLRFIATCDQRNIKLVVVF